MEAREQLLTDICIVGGGPAGYVAAIRASQLGATVVLIENRELGGTCLNRGCIPTKALLQTAEALRMMTKSKELGVLTSLSSTNLDLTFARKERIVKSLRSGIEHLMEKNKVQVLYAHAIIENSGCVVAKTPDATITVNCRKLLITTGSEPAIPDIPGVRLEGVLSSDHALALKEIPTSITILGAGAIGLEFATWFQALGTKVSVIEMMDSILPNEDQEMTTELLKIMKRQGIKFFLGAQVKEITRTENGLETHIETKVQTLQIPSEKILVATGRSLNSLSPDLVSLGVSTHRSAIVVNEYFETSVPNVYAAGDVIGGKLLAHLAFAQGRVTAENMLGKHSLIHENTIPTCVYTHPEVASVGMNEKQAQDHGISVKMGRFDLRNNGRAQSLGEREGFVKVITDAETGVILGACILGDHASELITELTLAVSLRVTADALANVIHPHPTLSEAIMEACADAAGRAIHQ